MQTTKPTEQQKAEGLDYMDSKLKFWLGKVQAIPYPDKTNMMRIEASVSLAGLKLFTTEAVNTTGQSLLQQFDASLASIKNEIDKVPALAVHLRLGELINAHRIEIAKIYKTFQDNIAYLAEEEKKLINATEKTIEAAKDSQRRPQS